MPNRRTSSPEKTPPRPRANFRQRYDDLETQRVELTGRLTALGESARHHTGYRHALKLLNVTFRESSLAQRLAVLQAAAWLIAILEKLTTTT